MSSPSSPMRRESASGLRVEINRNGSLRRLDCGDLMVNLFLGTEIEGGPANLYLRRLGRKTELVPLLGPRSPAAVRSDAHGITLEGEWNDIRFRVALVLPPGARAWFWHVETVNSGRRTTTIDLIYAQDLGLASYGAVRLNEYYVSQYIDYTPLQHAQRGTVLAARQNLSMGSRQPWTVIGSLNKGIGFATDALQLFGTSARACTLPAALAARRLGNKRLQHEHSMAVIQDAPVSLPPGETAQLGFFGWFEEDHPAATSDVDLVFVDHAIAVANVAEGKPRGEPSNSEPRAAQRLDRSLAPGGPADDATLFSDRPPLATLDLSDTDLTDLFGRARRHTEYRDQRLQSFFTGASTHVVLRDKELAVLRPHGHILRTGNRLTPDEAALTSTVWMDGVFNAMLTQGHVSINRFLSTTHTYLSLFCSHGQRLFVERPEGYFRLGVPSAFAMTANECRWLYRHDGGLIEVRTHAAEDRHEIVLSMRVISGSACRFLVSHHVALNGDDGSDSIPARFTQDATGVAVRAMPDSDVGRRFPTGAFRIDPIGRTAVERVGGDELLFLDGVSRDQPFVVLITAPAESVAFRITGQLIAETPSATSGGHRDLVSSFPFREPAVTGSANRPAEVDRIRDIVPWLTHNALIHYLAPRGLEQYSGGGWGTRDVCQGPVEMLLAMGQPAPVRDLLLRVFAAQNADGDWPQWFMFFERERSIRPNDSHGDIVFWPLLALSRYLLASDDRSLLDAVVPFFHADPAAAERATVWQHVERALGVIAARVIPNTHLAAYGHGDWNDSLQPVDPAMRERLCSAWTVTLHHETLTALADALQTHRPADAERLRRSIALIDADFQHLLIKDGVLAGFAYFHDEARIDYLLHPTDEQTGIHYRLLPMIHAILNGMLTRRQATRHIGLIRKRLLGTDGARLFDRPPRYQGGPQRYFQRAESSTYWGREIGLMYMHAHLRYAQAMAYFGDADAFFLALRQANPIALDAVVPLARPRQASCYYSSSDAVIADRYEAAARYQRVRQGKVAIEGGWRVYSSGAGIMLRLIYECLLGLRRYASTLVVDPVMPIALDGLRTQAEVAGAPVTVIYRVGQRGCGVRALMLNDAPLPFARERNPYRTGAAIVSLDAIRERARGEDNTLEIRVD